MSLNELQCKSCVHKKKIDGGLFCSLMNDAYCSAYNYNNKCKEYYKISWFLNNIAVLIYVAIGIAITCVYIIKKGILLYAEIITIWSFLLHSVLSTLCLSFIIFMVYGLQKEIEKEHTKYVNSIKE